MPKQMLLKIRTPWPALPLPWHAKAPWRRLVRYQQWLWHLYHQNYQRLVACFNEHSQFAEWQLSQQSASLMQRARKPVWMQPFCTSAFEETTTNHEGNGPLMLNTEYVVLQPTAIRIFDVQQNSRSVHTEAFSLMCYFQSFSKNRLIIKAQTKT